MKNINKLIKKFFEEQTEWAEINSDERFKEFFSRESYGTARVLYFAEFCEENPDEVYEWIARQEIYPGDDEKQTALCDLMCRKISYDSDRYLTKLVGSLI